MILFLLFMLMPLAPSPGAADVRIGTKNFTEGYLLGELIAQKIEASGLAKAERRFGLGGTGIVFEALLNGQIDLYVEYTGTIQEAILKRPGRLDHARLSEALASRGLVVSRSLGFNNTYALAVRRHFAAEHGLTSISGLASLVPKPRFGFTHEFYSRADGFQAFNSFYGLEIPRGAINLMEHSLLYPALAADKVDVIETYSTDGKIKDLDLMVLRDDRRFFPDYEAVILASQSFVRANPAVWRLLAGQLEGRLDESVMRALNSQVDVGGKRPAAVIAQFLNRSEVDSGADVWARVWLRTKEHAFLVGLTTVLCVLLGIPLALLCLRAPLLAQSILVISTVVQTIPSLALLVFLIPVFGIGRTPALIALFLYGLFPILVNTYVGISSLSPVYAETARALGLSRRQILMWIQLPLASPHILNGIRTSVVWTIGTATLAALIGAGGYGAPIITGLAMNSTPTILIGAIPAAVMALMAHGAFNLFNSILIPRGLRRH